METVSFGTAHVSSGGSTVGISGAGTAIGLTITSRGLAVLDSGGFAQNAAIVSSGALDVNGGAGAISTIVGRGQSCKSQAVHRSRLGHLCPEHDQLELRVCHRQRHVEGLERRRRGGQHRNDRHLYVEELQRQGGRPRTRRDRRSDRSQWGSVAPAPTQALPRGGIDPPDIAFGAQTTLAYSQNIASTGGTLTVSDDRHAAAIALIGIYMAGSFVIAADGHGGTLATQERLDSQPLLTRQHG
jgi:hypothetical protein